MTKISAKNTGTATVRKSKTATVGNQSPKPPQAVLDGLSATADRFMEASQSEASKCAYASDIRMFAASGITVPATAAQVIEYGRNTRNGRGVVDADAVSLYAPQVSQGSLR